jgi:hypothetical protein
MRGKKRQWLGSDARQVRAGLLIAVATLLSTPLTSAADPPEFRAFLLPATSTVSVGEAVDVRFEVDESGVQFNAYAVTIQYDPAIVDFEPPVVQGPLMTEVCGQTFFISERTDSTVTYTHSILCAGQTVNGPGVLSTYRFRAIANGLSPLAIISDPNCTFADAGECVNPNHPTFPRLEVLTGAEIRVGLPLGIGSAPTPGPRVTLLPNVPNPFNPATTLRFDLDRTAPVALTILDVAGRQVWDRSWPELTPGRHEILWTARDAAGAPLASGNYFLRLVAGDAVEGRKLSLVR